MVVLEEVLDEVPVAVAAKASKPSAVSAMDDIDEASSEEEDTVHRALMDAVVAGDLRRMHAALEEGADVNHEAGDGPPAERYTPLMAACYRGHLQAAELLLKHGADPNWENGAGESVLFWAVDGGPDVLRALCEQGADVDHLTTRGWSPLSYAAACGPYPRAYEPGVTPVSILQEYGATTFGVGPPSLWTAAEAAAARAGGDEGDSEEEEAAEELGVLTSLRGDADELHEGVVLPDAEGVRQEREKEQAAAGRAAAAEEEEEDMQAILNDLRRNPFVAAGKS